MATDEQRAVAQALHRLGHAIETTGDRMAALARGMSEIGRELRRVQPGALVDDKLTVLRRPLDGLRGAIDGIAAITGELRTIGDALAAVVGVDN